MPNVVITTAGLQYVLSAHDSGVYVDLRYFVPVYDDRIDPNVRDASVLSGFSDIQDESLTSPVGEKIWNVPGYNFSDNNDYLISASSLVGGVMQDTYQKTQVQTNTYGASTVKTPLSDQVSGTAYTVSAGSYAGVYDWTITDPAAVSGSNTRPTSTYADYFQTKDYYPVYDSSASNRLRGAFKVDMVQNVGKFKFNKIALYAVQVDANGTVLGEAFFGEAYLSEPVVKTSLVQDGFDNFIFDIQLDLSGTSATWDEVFFSSSADYWSQSPGGLYYPGKIGVGQFTDNAKEMSATMHLRKPRDVSGAVDNSIPTLRMDYDNDKFFTFDVTSATVNGNTTWTSAGDIVIKNAGMVDYHGDYSNIRPEIENTIGLGDVTTPFHHITVGSHMTVTNCITASSASGIDVSGLDIKISNDTFGNFKNGDFVVDDNQILSLLTNKSDMLIRTHGNERFGPYAAGAGPDIYIVAGANRNGATWDGGSLTHNSLVTELTTQDDWKTNFFNDTTLNILAKGGTYIHSNIMMDGNRDSLAQGIINSNAQILSEKYSLVLGAGVSGIDGENTFDVITNRLNTNTSDFTTMLNETVSTSRILLLAKEINTVGNIVPWIDSAVDIGSTTKRFANGYFDNLKGGNISGTDIICVSGNFEDLTVNNLVASSITLGGVALNNTLVDISSDQTILGTKTFSQFKLGNVSQFSNSNWVCGAEYQNSHIFSFGRLVSTGFTTFASLGLPEIYNFIYVDLFCKDAADTKTGFIRAVISKSEAESKQRKYFQLLEGASGSESKDFQFAADAGFDISIYHTSDNWVIVNNSGGNLVIVGTVKFIGDFD